MRMVLGLHSNRDFADLFSITFVWILPIIVGLTPLMFSPKEDLQSIGFRIFWPVFSVLIFFILCYGTGLEDIICILIISIPFVIVAAVSGVIFGGIILRYRKKRGIIYSIILLPILTGIVEPKFPTPTKLYETTSSIIIHANTSTIWENIVRVDTIGDTEYTKGFFNYAGIPRPLFAELDKDTLGGTRIGHFEGGLEFQERIIHWEKDKSVTFDIEIIPSKENKTIFERHMLDGEHFKFLNATYKLTELNNGHTELQLTTKYQLDTKVNFYGEFWGQKLLTDFQDRLVKVIKTRCEK